MDSRTPILADLVFLGGGHAHVAAIKKFAMNPLPGLRLTIVTSDIRTPYSGMLPGYIEGVWQDKDIHIDLAHLAQFAGARLIVAHCTGIDADGRTLFFDERPPLHFDLLSINIGGQPDIQAIEGAANHYSSEANHKVSNIFRGVVEGRLTRKNCRDRRRRRWERTGVGNQ